MKRTIREHVSYHRELYIFLPAIVLLCWAAIFCVNLLTGRPVSDPPELVIGFLYNAIGAVVVLVLTGVTQKHLFGFRSEKENPGLLDDSYDACVTAFLLCFFAFVLWH